MTPAWNPSACFLTLSRRRGIREASSASQKNRQRLPDALLAPAWKTRPALSTSFLRAGLQGFLKEVLLAYTVHFSKPLWACLSPSRAALLVCHHPSAILEPKLEVSLLPCEHTISRTMTLAWFILLARNTFTSRHPFLCRLETAVKMV